MTSARLRYPHRRTGLDHAWFRHEPTFARPPVTWPAGKPVALWITVPVEFFPLDADASPIRPLGGLDRGYPDFWSYSNRDYGTRIGVYRIMRVLDALGLRATAAVNAAVAIRHPRVVDEIVRRDWEVAAGGIDMGRIHHGKLLPETERGLIRQVREVLNAAAHHPVVGWYSPGHSQSVNTLTLLAESGFEYTTDWANDDLPYVVTTAAGSLCALPLTYEWSDRVLLVQHNLTVEDYEAQVLRAFQRLLAEAQQHQGGRILSLSISPWVMGYPHRIAVLERMLRHISDTGAVWNATAVEIVQTFKSQVAHPTESQNR